MNSGFDQINHFTDCGLAFPSVTFCGKIFNDLFVTGLSFNQFEDKYKRLSKSQIPHSTNWKSSVQYNLAVDVWGPKEAVLIFKQGAECDASIVYAIRNGGEFGAVENFLTNHPRVELLENKLGARTYNIKLPMYPDRRTRQVVIYLVRDTEQSAKITLLINF